MSFFNASFSLVASIGLAALPLVIAAQFVPVAEVARAFGF